MNSFTTVPGKTIEYLGRGKIDVDGRSAVGKKGFAAFINTIKPSFPGLSQKDLKREAIRQLEAAGRFFDPSSQPDLAGYKLNDTNSGKLVTPDSDKLPYSSVPAKQPILNLIPKG